MLGPDGNETCPNCYHVMIDLADFDARDDAIPVDRGGWSGGGQAWWEIDWEEELSYRFLYRIRASIRQWRLSRILRRYPRSLFCSGCGLILRRR